MCTDPVFRGWKGSETSYCRNSPVPQQETYRKRSSRERLMSVMNGGTALKPCRIGGRLAGSAGSAGISITFFIPHFPLSRYQIQIHAERSFSDTTPPRKPDAPGGSCAGRHFHPLRCPGPK